MKALVVICGITNIVFTAFHIWLGLQISRMSGVPEQLHALLKMLNTGGTIFILFLAMTLTFMAGEVVKTRLGGMILLLGAATYLVRGAEEFIVSSAVNVPILAACAVVGLLHLCAFVMLRCPCRQKMQDSLPEQSM
ncbi:MAG: hypothetical protein JW942_06195 [Opitutales bacterium]|nr:hypothetical protein [Opitutales bacterium]